MAFDPLDNIVTDDTVFLDGDVVTYRCNGDLIPSVPQTSQCSVTSGQTSWEITDTSSLQVCSEYHSKMSVDCCLSVCLFSAIYPPDS